MEARRLYYIAAVLVLTAVVLGILLYPAGGGSVEVSEEGSGGSSVGATARPYIDYKTEDGRVLRVYLDDGSKYWVNPDGSLTPYTGYTWTVPGTLSAISQVQVGFTVNMQGKYLKDVDSDGKQDITLKIRAYFRSNSTSNYYYCFGSSSTYTVQTYQVGTPSAGGSLQQDIQSGFKDIQTIFDTCWGGTPAQDTVYYPVYEVEVVVEATSVWNEALSKSATASYPHTTIGSWEWKQAELDVSLGGASASTQSLTGGGGGFLGDQGMLLLTTVLALILLLAGFALGRR